MSQSEFARIYGFPLRTLQKWERRERNPSTAAIAYLHAIAAMPTAVAKAVAEGFDNAKTSFAYPNGKFNVTDEQE